MAIFEFSDNFDAQGWYTEQMLKGHSFDEDGYGWDEPAEYPFQGEGGPTPKNRTFRTYFTFTL